jgi:hypothetical protein
MESNPEKGPRREVKLMLDAEAATMLLELAGSQRKQGEYVSTLIRAAFASREALAQVDRADVDELRELVRSVLLEVAALREQLAKIAK